MAVEFLDNFTELTTDTALPAHAPDTDVPAAGWAVTQINTTVDLVAAQATDTAQASADDIAGSTNGIYGVTGTLSDADYDVEVTVKAAQTGSGDDHAGIAGRYTDGDNFYGVLFFQTGSANRINLFKKVAGVLTSLATDTTTVLVADDVVKLEMRGVTLKVYVNGVEKLSVTDSGLASAGKALLGLGYFFNGTITGISSSGDIVVAWQFDAFTVTVPKAFPFRHPSLVLAHLLGR